MKKLKDTIYEDKEFIIIKKGVEDAGMFDPSVYLSLIYIAIQPLKEWGNFGCKYRKDAEEIVNKIHAELLECLEDEKESESLEHLEI